MYNIQVQIWQYTMLICDLIALQDIQDLLKI